MDPIPTKICQNKWGYHCIMRGLGETPCAQKIYTGKVWEPQTIALMRRHAVKGGDIIHAGTSHGGFLPGVAAAMRDGYLIWGFEGNPDNYRCAHVTMIINGLENVILHQMALAAKPGHARYLVRKNGTRLGGWSAIKRQPGREQDCVTVRTSSIDEIVPEDRPVRLIQLDIEGGEYNAIMGAKRTIERCRPALVLEGPPRRNAVTNLVESMGYEKIKRVHGNNVFRPRSEG